MAALFILLLVHFIPRIGATVPEIDFSLPAEGPSVPTTLRVVTFNIQDTPVVSSHGPERMRAIAAALCELDPDIVGFQESFISQDRAILIEELRACSRLQYHQYFPSGVMGSGLLVSSALPIVEISFMKFSQSNPLYKVWEGDWWAGKGVAAVRIALADAGGFVDVFNTHAQAGYGSSTYEAVRTAQMAELAEFVNRNRSNMAPALLVGDMNCRPGDQDYETAVSGAGLLRQMADDSGVDHIFAVENSAYSFETISTIRIEREVSLARGKTAMLSDHSGFMSVVQVVPQSGRSP